VFGTWCGVTNAVVNCTDNGAWNEYWLTISAHLSRTDFGADGLIMLLDGKVTTAEVGTDVGNLQLLTITTDEWFGTEAICALGNELGILEA